MRVYTLDPKTYTQEQIAVAFAKTSRRPASYTEQSSRCRDMSRRAYHTPLEVRDEDETLYRGPATCCSTPTSD